MAIGSATLTAADVKEGVISLPDDGIECKVLRGKTFAVEWAKMDVRGLLPMHTTRGKIEVPLAGCTDVDLVNGKLSLTIERGQASLHIGSQPWDKAKRQRGKASWSEYTGGTICDGLYFELFCAMHPRDEGAPITLNVNISNADAKIRKELASLVDPAATSKSPATGLAGKKRSAEDLMSADISKMPASQINALLRKMQQSPASAGGSSSSAF